MSSIYDERRPSFTHDRPPTTSDILSAAARETRLIIAVDV